MSEIEVKYPRVILGLDVSTTCIGASIVLDNGTTTPEILYITHVSPKISSKIKGPEALCMKKKIFQEEFLANLTGSGITHVVIEEPLLTSNNANTVATLLRFNGMIFDAVYSTLGIAAEFISSYDARAYSFPTLMAVRKCNKKGEVYSRQHIQDALKKNHLVLFGAYPFDVDKKKVMMDMVNSQYKDIEWIKDKNGNIKKENYDACDSLVCALAYINVTKNDKLEVPTITSYEVDEGENSIIFKYKTKVWNKRYEKKIVLDKE